MDIPQIKLLAGPHGDTALTGTGCFMNVIAYLNGEPTITDQSACVCYVMRPIAIWANDWMTDDERPALLPFLLRAMGSRTDDRAEITRRLALVVEFANKQKDFAAKNAQAAAQYAQYAAQSAQAAAQYRKDNVAAILALFDAAFPPLDEVSEVTLQRVRTLEAINA